jgi:hypothetical protein
MDREFRVVVRASGDGRTTMPLRIGVPPTSVSGQSDYSGEAETGLGFSHDDWNLGLEHGYWDLLSDKAPSRRR